MQDLWERIYIVAIGRLSARDDYELPALVKRAARIADLAEEEVRRRQAGDVKLPWNKCAKCGQLVDCDDVHDGSEVRCLGCSAVNVVVEAGDGSFSLALQKGA